MTDFSDRYNGGEDQVAATMRRHAIVTLRYKVYIFILVVVLVFFWPIMTAAVDTLRGEGAAADIFSVANIMSIGTNLTSARGEGGILNSLDAKKKEVEEVQADIDRALLTSEVIEKLNDRGKQNTIINCLNNNVCDDIDAELLPYLGLFRTYLLIGNLQGTKMDFDQKTILKNINDFLLKTSAGLDNGRLLGITFGRPTRINEKVDLYELPINISVEFDHWRMLFSFLHNVEERISFTIPILYKVDALSYNIVDYNEQQTVEVSLLAYYIDGLETTPDIGEVMSGAVVEGTNE